MRIIVPWNRSSLRRPGYARTHVPPRSAIRAPLVAHMFLEATMRILVVGSLVALFGCAGSIETWIVNTRIRQGDIALENHNSSDALLAYSLALRVDPSNAQARTGFVTASADEAQSEYTHGKFDDALVTIAAAAKVDATSVRLQALRTTIDNARLKQEIVQSNYPAYEHAGLLIRQSYARLDEANTLLLRSLRRFQYTYNVADLTEAIRQSYELQLEVARDTSRLIAYRQLVQTGAPASATGPSAAGSLLPLP
jgi:hypothetical protein